MDLYCIHLPHRKDRRTHLDAIQAKYPSIKIHLVEGVVASTSILGCQLSHKKCVQMAKDAGWPYILVMEDDCDFWLADKHLRRALETMADYYTYHPDVDIINGCGNLETFAVTSCEKFKDVYFLKSPRVYTAHCVMYTARAYDKILGVAPGMPIDVIQNDWNLVYTYPYLATQIPSYSDLQKADVNYDNIRKSRSFVANHIQSLRQ